LNAQGDFERLFCWFKTVTGISQTGHPGSTPISAVEASKNALKTGFLKKLGYINPEWQQRYIVVTDSKIYWFNESNSFQQNGELDKKEILQVHKTSLRGELVVCVVTKERKFAFTAGTETELNEWEFRFKTPELVQKEAQIEEEKRLKEEERQRALAEEQRKLQEKLAYFQSWWVDPFQGGAIVKSWEYSKGTLLCKDLGFEYSWLMTKDGMLLQSTNRKAGYLIFNVMTNGFWSFELMSQSPTSQRPKLWMVFHFNPEKGVFSPAPEYNISPSWVYHHQTGTLTIEGTPQQTFPFILHKIEALGVPPPLLLFVALMETLGPQIAEFIDHPPVQRAVVAQSVYYGAPPVTPAPKPRNSLPQHHHSSHGGKPAILCSQCGFGSKKDNCVLCGKWVGSTKRCSVLIVGLDQKPRIVPSVENGVEVLRHLLCCVALAGLGPKPISV